VGHDYDVAIIGSGFGGSVAALRLTEKGYRVVVLECGRRWTPENLPKTNWDARNFFWFPRLGMRGFQRMTLLKDVFVVSGSAVGGGSVVYANTLYEPLPAYWSDRQWAHITDWQDELAPHYDQAKRMLGVTPTPFETAADKVMRTVASRLGVEDTFHPTNVGVWFGKPGERVPDPYFGGEGPDRVGCIRCGGCMVGCRHEAKNSLDHNYLYLAEKHGAVVMAERQVSDLRPMSKGGYRVISDRPGAILRHDWQEVTAEHVIVAAGSLGTQKLLHALKDRGTLPNISDRLGQLTRTNSEAILGATAKDHSVDYSTGIAITSSIHLDDHTHVEPVRYPKGSNAVATLTAPLVDGGGSVPRPLRFLLMILRNPLKFLKQLNKRRWSEKGIILLVMQSLDNSLNTRLKKGLFGAQLTTEQGHGEPNPTWIPEANEVARQTADVMGGDPYGSIFEATLDVPTTAHIIGGCPIGDSSETGVIDPYHRVYGHEGLHVVDGSAITANLGVNPSLSITALAERAMSLWPNRGEEDQRPPLGAPYQRIAPIPPQAPTVPTDAPAALHLPILPEAG
jgi:cholesterol oxidase